MKPLLLLLFLFLIHSLSAQSLDYISVRKKSGRVVKNFYAGSSIVLETTDNTYLQGPIKIIRNDTVVITQYDVRLYRTPYGSVMRDTITSSNIGIYYKDIKRILLNQKTSFLQRTFSPLLMLGGSGYFAITALNGAFYSSSTTGNERIKKLGISAGLFGLGYFLQKLFTSDGFSQKRHQIMYVDL